MKPNIQKLGYVLLGSFALVSLYLGYVNVIWGPHLTVHPYNRRLAAYEAQIHRGTIYDRQGAVLAQTKEGRRYYALAQDAAHPVGFVSERYGRTGLESAFDRYLLGQTSGDRLRMLWDRLRGRPLRGNDVVVTLDARLQRLAMQLLAGRKGAAVVLDPRSGAILALASSPSFDPNRIEEHYQEIQRAKEAPLFNRAIQGAYPPGSTFKLVTAAGILAVDPGVSKRIFNCQGSITVEGFELRDTAVHGKLDFERALALSCNSTFAQLGLELGAQRFYQTARAFGLTQNPWENTDTAILPYRPGTLTPPEKMNRPLLASSAIGQGEVLVSPLQMALVAAAIANDGVIMRPYFLDRVQDPSGRVVYKNEPRPWLKATDGEVAKVIKKAMVAVVRDGTGREASLPGVSVAGKTGSAQNPHGDTHAWFVGFAPAENPRVVVAVIVENGGSGGAVAAPVARELMRLALSTVG